MEILIFRLWEITKWTLESISAARWEVNFVKIIGSEITFKIVFGKCK